MKKRMRRLTSVLLSAVMAASAMTASSSALTLCIGGRCFDITLPSCMRATVMQYCGKNCTTASVPSGTVITAPEEIQTGGGDISVSADVSEVLSLVNSTRANNGLPALTLSSELSAAAEVRAREIVRSFSHTRPNGTSCFTVLKENGITYRSAGENVAYGQKTAASVMNAWLNSSGHRANILGKNFGKIGIACYTQNGVKYWVQLFTD